MTGLLVFWIAVLIGIPLCVLIGRYYRPFLYFLFGLMIFSTAEPHWSITFVSREFYKSATRGLEVHVLDLCAIVLALSMLLRPAQYPLRWRLPMITPYLFFLAIGILSWVNVNYVPSPTHLPKDLAILGKSFELQLYPFFELIKLLRGLFVFWVVANFVNNETSLRIMIGVIVLLIVYLFVECLFHRYVLGEYRVSVNGMNFNDFNVYIGMLGIFILPLAFSTQNKLMSFVIWMTFLFTLTSILLTVSRSSLVGFLLGACFVIAFGLIRYPKIINILVAGFFLFMGMLLVIKASHLLIARFEGFTVDVEFRDVLLEMAMMMAKDYPLGVGLGNYAAMAYLEYSPKVHALEPFIIAHNIWYLTMAEVGYVGLLVFVVIWVRFYQFLALGMYRTRKVLQDNAYEVFLGTLAASIPLHMQGFYHFSFRQTSVFFLFIITMGTAASFYYMQRKQRMLSSVEPHGISY